MGIPNFWHKANLALDEADRTEYNKWRADLYRAVEKLEDEFKTASVDVVDVQSRTAALKKQITEIPYLYE